MSIAQLLLDIYGGNPYHAVAKVSTATNGMYYDLIETPLTEELLEKHLEGEVTLGSYVLEQGSNLVKHLTWDVDSAGDIEEARKISMKIISRIQHLPYAVFFSGNKGYHITLFLETPQQASKVKAVGEFIRDAENIPRSGNPHVEVYPKQAHLSDSAKMGRRNVGNLIKIPLGIHPSSHNRSVCVDPRNGFENGIPLAPEEVLQYRVTAEELYALAEVDKATLDGLASAIALEWDSGRRHDLCLFLSGYLAQIGWTYEKVLDLVDSILEKRPDDLDAYNRRQAVEHTFKKYNRGDKIAGFQSLSEVISGGLMKTISEEAPLLVSPTIARQIDNIRFDKGAGWKKERDVANLIWNWITDSENGGRVLRVDPTGLNRQWNIYFFNQETRMLIPIDSQYFDDYIYRQFNLSNAESFTQKVKGIVILKARSEGEIAEIHQRSVYKQDEGILYVNLGGVEIYACDGENEFTTLLNGDNNIFFQTSDPYAVKPSKDPSMYHDIWEELIGSINFESSSESPMRPEEQAELLKSWILAYFFRSMLPTRPILTLLGAPGSGKTTAIRQILRTLEGLSQNVSGISDEKSDAWRAMIEHKSFVALDNLEESNVKWLSRALDLIATGQIIEVRQLYTTNEMYSIKPDVFVSLTAVELPFSKETVFERMLVLNMHKLDQFIPAHIIEERLKKNISGLWGHLLQSLNEIVHILNTVNRPRIAIQVRMADFAQFAMWIKSASFMDADHLERGLRFLGNAQQAALASSENSAFPMLLEWAEQNPIEAAQPRLIGDVFEVVKEIAKSKGRKVYWKTNQAFARHIHAMEDTLRNSLGMELEKKYDKGRGRDQVWYSFKPFGDITADDINVIQQSFTIDLTRGDQNASH